MIDKFKKISSGIKKGWIKMSNGKRAYSILWSITGAFLISLIVIFVTLNDTYKQANPPKDGWTLNENQPVFPGETKPDLKDYKVLTEKATEIYDLKNYKPMSTAKKDENFKNDYHEGAFIFNGETLVMPKTSNDYLKGYIPINRPSSIPWANGPEYISPKFVRGGFDAKNNFVARTPIYSVNKWVTTPTDKAKTAATATAAIAFVWAVIFTGANITTVVVSKKEKGGGK